MSKKEEEVVSSGDRMTDAEFATARERYELGTAGLVELADEYGVSRQALSKRFKNNGVKKGSRADEVAEAAGQGARKAAEDSGAEAIRFADKRTQWIEETRVQGVNALKQARLIGQKVIIDAIRKKGPIGDVADDIKAIQNYSKMLIENTEASLRILKSDDHVDEDDLPSLVIEDLTNEEILEHHKNTGALDEDVTVEEMLAENIDIEESS